MLSLDQDPAFVAPWRVLNRTVLAAGWAFDSGLVGERASWAAIAPWGRGVGACPVLV